MSAAAPRLGLHRLPHGEGIAAPRYESEGAAGADLRAALGGDLVIAPGARALIPSGFAFTIPPGFEMQVRPRSGLAARHGVTVLNAPGTVDADYRGEVMAILVNHGAEPFTVRRGDRIAQVVVAPVVQAEFAETDAPPQATRRGTGGFGSTGLG